MYVLHTHPQYVLFRAGQPLRTVVCHSISQTHVIVHSLQMNRIIYLTLAEIIANKVMETT